MTRIVDRSRSASQSALSLDDDGSSPNLTVDTDGEIAITTKIPR
jgi:hypothetical protein